MTWQRTKPEASADLESAPVRGNFQELDSVSWGNLMPDPYHLIWPAGDSAAPAGTALEGTGGAVARIATAGNHLAGGMACQLTLGSANTILRRTLIPASELPPELQGAAISIGCAVKSSTASLADIRIDDGVTVHNPGAFHTGGGSFEWIFFTTTLNGSATKLDILYYLDVGAGAGTAIFDLPTLIFGAIPPQRFIPPKISEGFLYASVPGEVAIETNRSRFWSGLPFIVRNVSLHAETVNTGAALIVDVNHWDGSAWQSMFSTRPQIADGASTKSGGANPDGTYRYRCFDGRKNAESLTDCLVNVDIDQVGSSVAGSDLGIDINVLQFAEPLRAMAAYF